MAASLGLCHETSHAYSSASWCFPPIMAGYDVVDDDGAAARGSFFVPAGGGGSFGDFLELGHSDYYYSLPPPPPQQQQQQQVVIGGGSEYGVSSSSMATTSRIGFRTRSEVEVLDDGFKWRKYGKKAVKSSPNPRNYYRCSAAGCGVKKRVERDRDDPRYVVTTYDGVHNHATPGAGGHPPYPSAPASAPAWSVPVPNAAGLAASPPTQAWGTQLHAAAAAAHSSESSF